jgi:hypothetical protein
MTFFAKYALHKLRSLGVCLGRHNRITSALMILFLALWMASRLNGPHQKVNLMIDHTHQHLRSAFIGAGWLKTVGWMERQVTWYGYWMVLGIASSVGLGSGLHTFLLFLGPYIAEVTMAVHECNTIDGVTRNLSTQVKQKGGGSSVTCTNRSSCRCLCL